MRRQLIRSVLPLLLCCIPFLAAGAIASAIEERARDFYLKKLTRMDYLILILGVTLFTFQIIFVWRALRWRDTNFDDRPDKWLNNLSQASEWFPLLGLLGTVAAILQTFNSITIFSPQEIIESYAPAITATGSGLFMALINILPTWMVSIGRDLIRTLGGEDPPPAPPTATAIATPTRSDATRTPRSQAGTEKGS